MVQALKRLGRSVAYVWDEVAVYVLAALLAYRYGFEAPRTLLAAGLIAGLIGASKRYRQLLEEERKTEDVERAKAETPARPVGDRRPVPWRPVVVAGLKSFLFVVLLAVMAWIVLVMRMRMGAEG